MDDLTSLRVRFEVLEEKVINLSESVCELENKIMNKLDKIESKMNEYGNSEARIEVMTDTMWKKYKNSEHETFTQGTHRLISTVAIWASGVTISTIIVTLLQKWVKVL